MPRFSGVAAQIFNDNIRVDDTWKCRKAETASDAVLKRRAFDFVILGFPFPVVEELVCACCLDSNQGLCFVT
jgi:hypothetical protein